MSWRPPPPPTPPLLPSTLSTPKSKSLVTLMAVWLVISFSPNFASIVYTDVIDGPRYGANPPPSPPSPPSSPLPSKKGCYWFCWLGRCHAVDVGISCSCCCGCGWWYLVNWLVTKPLASLWLSHWRHDRLASRPTVLFNCTFTPLPPTNNKQTNNKQHVSRYFENTYFVLTIVLLKCKQTI